MDPFRLPVWLGRLGQRAGLAAPGLGAAWPSWHAAARREQPEVISACKHGGQTAAYRRGSMSGLGGVRASSRGPTEEDQWWGPGERS
ncbi:hypothetical protein NDU88_003249 [Pleurodeles waltl]|uniref:Uncharacterized protein n=1 Tax=Pleurodeles waltl TaxID=8319 RepID=A0AAV7MZM0_PLEWA|nr:hypothetical protein NDU88_003249 [Pleurodeles waltl]